MTQKEEIATIKPRSFTLELSDADVKRLYEKAYSNGTTPAEMMQSYLGDLLDGTYTRGSDERMYANQYFDRCCYDLWLDNRDFLQWSLYYDRLDSIADALETIDYASGDLAYYEKHPDDPDGTPDFLENLRKCQASAENDLKEIYAEYKADYQQAQPFNDGIETIKKYLHELQSMIERGEISE